jgi:ubiquilin
MLGGVGGYEMVNHPQYMSAISQAVDPERAEEMLDDPQVQGMLEQMMDDPDTLRQMINENPMTRNMMKDNPMMQAMMNNPALLKMVFSTSAVTRQGHHQEDPGVHEERG